MYLLDTNIISQFLRQNPQVTKKIISTDPSLLFCCSPVAHELLYGSYLNPHKTEILLKFYYQFFQKVEIVNYDLRAAQFFALTKINLKQDGSAVDDLDLMIAAICIANNLILVTNNTKHFKHVENLQLEDWSV